jgi:hypothetical protein
MEMDRTEIKDLRLNMTGSSSPLPFRIFNEFNKNDRKFLTLKIQIQSTGSYHHSYDIVKLYASSASSSSAALLLLSCFLDILSLILGFIFGILGLRLGVQTLTLVRLALLDWSGWLRRSHISGWSRAFSCRALGSECTRQSVGFEQALIATVAWSSQFV